jgi:transcriptional regulator CtsR
MLTSTERIALVKTILEIQRACGELAARFAALQALLIDKGLVDERELETLTCAIQGEVDQFRAKNTAEVRAYLDAETG